MSVETLEVTPGKLYRHGGRYVSLVSCTYTDTKTTYEFVDVEKERAKNRAEMDVLLDRAPDSKQLRKDRKRIKKARAQQDEEWAQRIAD